MILFGDVAKRFKLIYVFMYECTRRMYLSLCSVIFMDQQRKGQVGLKSTLYITTL